MFIGIQTSQTCPYVCHLMLPGRVQEAKECVKEIPVKNLTDFVDIALNHVLERNTKARQQTGALLHDLVINTVLTTEQYLDGSVLTS